MRAVLELAGIHDVLSKSLGLAEPDQPRQGHDRRAREPAPPRGRRRAARADGRPRCSAPPRHARRRTRPWHPMRASPRLLLPRPPDGREADRSPRQVPERREPRPARRAGAPRARQDRQDHRAPGRADRARAGQDGRPPGKVEDGRKPCHKRSACTTSSPPRARATAASASAAARARASARPRAAARRAAARARATKSRAGFEGGQNPIQMRMRKLRGPHMKKSMPFEKFRTATQPVNLSDLEARFDAGAEVTPESLAAAGLATRRDVPVKILGRGRDLEGADRSRARRLRHRAREDRGRRRHLHTRTSNDGHHANSAASRLRLKRMAWRRRR